MLMLARFACLVPLWLAAVVNMPAQSNPFHLLFDSPQGFGFGLAQAMAVADFNGDGNLDFAITDEGRNSLAIFLSNGMEVFRAPSR